MPDTKNAIDKYKVKLELSLNASNAIKALNTPMAMACILTLKEIFARNPNTEALKIAMLRLKLLYIMIVFKSIPVPKIKDHADHVGYNAILLRFKITELINFNALSNMLTSGRKVQFTKICSRSGNFPHSSMPAKR